MSDPSPLSVAQLRALGAGAARELSWGLREVGRALRGWRALAECIPDPTIRADALSALDHKRGHADGAALFSILPARRDNDLLQLLVAYETIWDFLDNVNERHATEANGRELHQALIDAVDPGRPLADYYRHHPTCDDGGYLEALVEFCRARCQKLPSYDRVRPLLVREAERTEVLGLNHLSDPSERDAALQRWAQRNGCEKTTGARWFELSGAASASLTVHVLLALATEPCVDRERVERVHSAYWPWISLATTMLDSYVDQVEDRGQGEHSYIAHYSGEADLVDQLEERVARASRMALALPDGHRHAVIVSSMVAMYLSKDSARTAQMRCSTRRLVRAGGSLARLLLPILRIWRVAYSQRAH